MKTYNDDLIDVTIYGNGIFYDTNKRDITDDNLNKDIADKHEVNNINYFIRNRNRYCVRVLKFYSSLIILPNYFLTLNFGESDITYSERKRLFDNFIRQATYLLNDSWFFWQLGYGYGVGIHYHIGCYLGNIPKQSDIPYKLHYKWQKLINNYDDKCFHIKYFENKHMFYNIADSKDKKNEYYMLRHNNKLKTICGKKNSNNIEYYPEIKYKLTSNEFNELSEMIEKYVKENNNKYYETYFKLLNRNFSLVAMISRKFLYDTIESIIARR